MTMGAGIALEICAKQTMSLVETYHKPLVGGAVERNLAEIQVYPLPT
jgi:hypothetical protein